LTPAYLKEFVERKIGKLDCKIDINSDKYEAWSTYIANCDTKDEEKLVIHNPVICCFIGTYLILLKEIWQNWKFFKDAQELKNHFVEILRKEMADKKDDNKNKEAEKEYEYDVDEKTLEKVMKNAN